MSSSTDYLYIRAWHAVVGAKQWYINAVINTARETKQNPETQIIFPLPGSAQWITIGELDQDADAVVRTHALVREMQSQAQEGGEG